MVVKHFDALVAAPAMERGLRLNQLVIGAQQIYILVVLKQFGHQVYVVEFGSQEAGIYAARDQEAHQCDQ